MSKRARPLDRLLWGVRCHPGGLINVTWHRSPLPRPLYAGEPIRPLLFWTREQARAWCQREHEFYATYPNGHVCRAWRFRPVRVRERIVEVRHG